MSRLFIELYLDEDVDVMVADLLQARGFEALTAQQADQLGKKDEQQLAYAVSLHRALLTHNRPHFEALAQQYFQAGQTHYGIFIAVRRSPYEIARRVLEIISRVTMDEMKDQLRYI